MGFLSAVFRNFIVGLSARGAAQSVPRRRPRAGLTSGHISVGSEQWAVSSYCLLPTAHCPLLTAHCVYTAFGVVKTGPWPVDQNVAGADYTGMVHIL